MSHWGIITAGDVQAEQARTLASAQTTDQAVQACTTMDAATKSEWATFYGTLTAWCQTPVVNFWTPFLSTGTVVVTGDTGDTMMAYETQLQAWQQKIAGICKATPPGLTTFDPDPAGAQATQWLRYGAIIAGFIGTAYVVGEVVQFIPKPIARAPKKVARAASEAVRKSRRVAAWR
jgi:hypothetical protein